MKAKLLSGAMHQETTVTEEPAHGGGLRPPQSIYVPKDGDKVGPADRFDLLAIQTGLDGERVAVYSKHEPGLAF